ncbi:M23 family metallopeptidase [Streptomyces sp. NPDC002044]|uniref:M23 family metallopeptidase n=1 Tax=Streptomyces sp. NPDC002044 TaxID=3154662 RepID=UPI0033247A28
MPAPEGTEIQEQPTAGAWGEWNPTEDSVRPVRGKHRVARQRGGLARSSTVLGVGVIAAVGAGGIATAQDRPQVAISLPSLPSLSDVMDTGSSGGNARQEDGGSGGAAAAAAGSGIIPRQADRGTDAGEVLRNRILQQAESQQDAAEAQVRAEAERIAQEAAAEEAKAKREDARKAAEKAAAEAEAKTVREAAQAREAAEAKAEQAQQAERAERDRAATPSGAYSLPTSAYTLTSRYGASGSMWSSGHHTGLDFAAPTGTPAKAVAAGKIVSAGWSGAYGYRIVLELEDGTEVWYCHLSSMSVTSGSVAPGETIGRVGATGNVTGPHLHLEVRTGGSTVDPMAWLNSKGLKV